MTFGVRNVLVFAALWDFWGNICHVDHVIAASLLLQTLDFIGFEDLGFSVSGRRGCVSIRQLGDRLFELKSLHGELFILFPEFFDDLFSLVIEKVV